MDAGMKLVFLLEEKSMKYFIDGILPSILPNGVSAITIPHEGKDDLKKSIPIKLRGWNEPDVKFVIIHDQDFADCKILKQELKDICDKYNREVLIRIACHELEAWYFGDLEAVSKAYHKDLGKYRAKRMYRNPDDIQQPKMKIRKLIPEHQQISGAKKISQYIDIDRNSSKSFQVFISGVRKLVGGNSDITGI